MRCIDDKGYPKDQLKVHGLENYAEERFWIILAAGHISCYKKWPFRRLAKGCFQIPKPVHSYWEKLDLLSILEVAAQSKRDKTECNTSELFLWKSVLKNGKFTGKRPCQRVIPIKLQSSFIKIALRHGCSPVNLLHIFRTPFHKNTSRVLLLNAASLGVVSFL